MDVKQNFACRLILNHAPTGEYRARFFPYEETTCNWCNTTQTRPHIIFRCTHYQRPPSLTEGFFRAASDPVPLIVTFLKDNPSAFTFEDAPLNAEDLLAIL